MGLGGLLPPETSSPVKGARHLYQNYLKGPCQALKCRVETSVWQGGQKEGVPHLGCAGWRLLLRAPSPGSWLAHFGQREPEGAMILSGAFVEDIARGQV